MTIWCVARRNTRHHLQVVNRPGAFAVEDENRTVIGWVETAVKADLTDAAHPWRANLIAELRCSGTISSNHNVIRPDLLAVLQVHFTLVNPLDLGTGPK